MLKLIATPKKDENIKANSSLSFDIKRGCYFLKIINNKTEIIVDTSKMMIDVGRAFIPIPLMLSKKNENAIIDEKD